MSTDSFIADFFSVIIFSSILVVFLLLTTFWTFKIVFKNYIKKRKLKQAIFLLNNGWSIASVNSEGIPLIFQKKDVFVTYDKYKEIMDKKNATI